MRRSLALALVSAALALGACPRPDDPADRYRRFAAAARAGDADAVWSMLSGASREAFDAEARALSARAPKGVIPPSGRDLVVSDQSARAPRIRSAVVVRESAGTAVVRVEDDAGATGEVTLVREGGAWRVVVPPAAR